MHKKYNGDNLPDLDLNVKGASSNLLAVVRCRPLLQKDLMNNSHECVSLLSDSLLLISEPYDTDGHTGSEKTRKLQFEFPRVFSKNTTNQEVYNQTAKPLLPGLFEGLNATVFCYGAAQSGKTHTMMGNNEQQGLISYALDDLQTMIEAPERMGSVMKVSYIEIHNEVIRDLLVADDKNIDIREDPVKGTIVVNISEFTTSVKKDILRAIK
jgi:Kinesin motor domain